VGDKGLGAPRTFNLLFSTHVGPVLPGDAPTPLAEATSTQAQARAAPAPAGGFAAAGAGGGAGKAATPRHPHHGTSYAFLRPETAQGVYVHFLNVLNTSRKRLPFGVGQAGKSFRNEIAVANFVFRTREFEQMELQYFCHPEESPKWCVVALPVGSFACLAALSGLLVF
jgi:hypothetical protein